MGVPTGQVRVSRLARPIKMPLDTETQAINEQGLGLCYPGCEGLEAWLRQYGKLKLRSTVYFNL